MCGINGIAGTYGSAELIERMTRQLVHRGPDGSGSWEAPGVRFGHTRLAILDLSEAGRQPMTFGPFTITYNGEIYNHQALRSALPGPFRSHCDTETLLHLYARDRDDCVRSLQGMFAFAVWDAEARRLFAARDRLGIKPLYYRPLPGGLAFASEIRSLLQIDRPAIDQTSLRDFFTYKYVPAPKTIYQGIYQLAPGHTLVWDADRGLRLSRYWCPSSAVVIRDADEAGARLDALLRQVVPAHTLADVPVGVFLSGGIDSTTVAAFLERPRTFTLGMDIERRDEAPIARRVAQHFGTVHFEETASAGDLEEAVNTVAAVWDEPFGDSSAWATFQVSRLARRHVTVALSGDGGDELFCGYQWYSKWLLNRSTPVSRLLSAVVPAFSAAARSMTRRAATGLERYAAFLSPFTPRQRTLLLAPDLTGGDYDDLWHFREYWREDLEPLKRMQWADLHTYLPGDLLLKVDRASMAHSLEVRPPLLDHRLVEFALSLDSRLLRDVDGGKGKLVLRRLVGPRVPAGLFDRKKRGFNLPIRSWVRQHHGLVESAVARLARAGIIRQRPTVGFSHEQIWMLLILDRWLVRTSAL